MQAKQPPQNHLTHNRIVQAFQSLSYAQRDYIAYEQLQKLLSELSNQEFDPDIMEQLWQQCKLNSQGQAKISNFVDTLIRAQAILMQKQKETEISIKNIQQKVRSKATPNEDKIQLNLQLNQLNQLKSGFATDLQLIRKPFSRFMVDNTTIVRGAGPETVGYHSPMQPNAQASTYSLPVPINNKQNLALIFYLTCICIAAEVLVYLHLNAFMNSVLFLLILSLFFFQHFDRRTIRFLFWFSCFTLIVDIIWYVIAAKNVWNTKEVGIWPNFLGGYLKLSVIIISCVFVLKVVIAILLCSQYNINEKQPQEVNLCGKQFILRSDNTDVPLKKALLQFNLNFKKNQQITAESASN